MFKDTAHANSCCNGATSFIERAHGGRFVGKYSTFGQNDNFARILRLLEVRDPYIFLDTSPSLTDFCNVGSLIFSNFSTPARSNSTRLEGLRVWKCNYVKLVLP